MKRFRIIFRMLVTALVAGSLFAPAMALAGKAQPIEPNGVVRQGVQMAQADCYAIGESIAAQHGGQVARAQARSQGGQTVCVIVILLPAKEGQRGRRLEFVVPAN